MPNSHDGRERIAKLEQHKEDTDKQLTNVLVTLKHIDNKMETIDGTVGKIEMRMEKSFSFFGGVAFTFSALGGVFVVVAQYVARKMGLL